MTAATKHLSAATKMAKIKSGAWYVDGDVVFQVLGINANKARNYHADLYNIEYVGIRREPIPSNMFADKIRTCTQITEEVADIVLAVT